MADAEDEQQEARTPGTTSPTISYGENLVHEHDGVLRPRPRSFRFRRRRADRAEPDLDAGSRHADERRHRHRLLRHAGDLLAHQSAPLWRGPDQPLLRRVARDALSVAGGADALSERGAHRRRRARPDHRRRLCGRRPAPGPDRYRRRDPHRRGAAARECAGHRQNAVGAGRRIRLRHRRPSHGIDAGGLRLRRLAGVARRGQAHPQHRHRRRHHQARAWSKRAT